jgi:ribonuclease Y
MTLTAIIISIVCLLIVIGFFSKSSLNSKAKFIVKDAKKTAENIIENANVKAEAIKKEKEAQAKVKFLELKSQHDENIQSREKKCKKQRKESETKNKNLMMSLAKRETRKRPRKTSCRLQKKRNHAKKQQELDIATAQKVEMLEKFLTILPKKLKMNW